MNITLKQVALVKTVLQIEDSEILDEVARSIEQTILKYQRLPKKEKKAKKPKSELEKLHELAKQPTPKHIPLEVLAKEQNFTNEGFAEALNSVDDTLFENDNLEELLTTLTR
jgi:hypothetical protein